jgi:hypothetical protein
MSSLAEMRKQLREARKETVKPVSRMKKGDVLMELEKLKNKREETPPVASTGGAKPKKMEAVQSDVKVAKEKGFPTKPVEEAKAKKDKGSAVPKTTVAAKKMSKMDRLMAMVDEMDDDE